MLDTIAACGEPLDFLVLNTGVMAVPLGRTAQEFEIQFGTNYLGHFVLANRLAQLPRTGEHVVSLSSAAHRHADIDLDDPKSERTPYEP